MISLYPITLPTAKYRHFEAISIVPALSGGCLPWSGELGLRGVAARNPEEIVIPEAKAEKDVFEFNFDVFGLRRKKRGRGFV